MEQRLGAVVARIVAAAGDDYVLEEQIGHLLRRAHQRASAIFVAELGELHRITPTQFAALVKLRDVGEPSQNELRRLTAMRRRITPCAVADGERRWTAGCDIASQARGPQGRFCRDNGGIPNLPRTRARERSNVAHSLPDAQTRGPALCPVHSSL